MNLDTNDVVECLNNENFKGFTSIKCGTALFVSLALEDRLHKSYLRSTVRTLFSCLFTKIRVSKDDTNKSKFIFLCSNRTRRDYRAWMLKVADLVKNKTVFFPGFKFRVSNILNLPIFFSWFKIFRKYYNCNLSYYYTSILFSVYCDFQFIKKHILSSDIKLFVSYFDVAVLESVVTQYCNLKAIPSATLQHGFMIAGPVLSLSRSDFFLAYGQHTAEQAILSGRKPGTIVNVGMPQLIGSSVRKQATVNKNKIIGVILNGNPLYEDDYNLLNMALNFANKNNYKIYVKLHPGTLIDKYPDFDWKNVTKIYATEISALEFGTLIEFALVSASTVFIEYALNLVPVFLCPSCKSFFARETWCKVNNEYELQLAVEALYKNPDGYFQNMIRSRQYYSETENIEANYLKFFKKYI